jgi:hypothetical protein
MERDWQGYVKGLLKAELKRKGLSYKDLADRLHDVGVKENDANIRTKISRGGFTAVFLIQCLLAIGATTIHLHDA